jgi:hypothetical protein
MSIPHELGKLETGWATEEKKSPLLVGAERMQRAAKCREKPLMIHS